MPGTPNSLSQAGAVTYSVDLGACGYEPEAQLERARDMNDAGRQKNAYGMAMLAVLSWSTVATAFKISLRHLGQVELMLYSSATAAAVLAVVLLATGKMGEVFRTSGRDWFRSVLLGLMNPFLYYIVLFRAYALLPAQQVQALNYTWVLALALLSVPLLGQRISRVDFAGLLVGYAGVVVVATQGRLISLGATTSAPGVALALASTVIWALYWIGNTRDRREPVVCLFQSFVSSLVPALICCACFEGLRVPPAAGLLGAAYVGTFEMSMPFLVWSLTLKRSENTAKVGSLILLTPCISLLFIGAILHETIRLPTVAGLVLIMAGVLIQRFARKPAQEEMQERCR